MAVGASSLSSLRPPFRGLFRLKLYRGQQVVPDPDPPDPNVFGPSGSGSISQRYGSGSFYQKALEAVDLLTLTLQRLRNN